MAERMIFRLLSRFGSLVLLFAVAATAGAQSFRELARDAASRGDNNAALDYYEKALVSAVKVFKEDDLELVVRRAELGEAYRAAGKWKEAITNLDYAWKRARFDAESKSRWKEQEGDIAMNCGEKLGRACQADSRYEDAIMVFRTAIADNANAGRASDEAAHFWALLADNFLLLKRDAEADQAAKEALSISETSNANNPRGMARVLSLVANMYLFHEQTAKARPLYERAVQIAARNLEPGDEDRIMLQARLGAILLKDGKLDEAGLLLNDSLSNLLKANTPDSVKMISLHFSLSELASRRGQHEDALKHAQESLRICKLHYMVTHPDIARSLLRLGSCLVDLNETDKAKKTLRQAYELSLEVLGKDSPQTAKAGALLVQVGGKLKVGEVVKEEAKQEEEKAGIENAEPVAVEKKAP